MWFPVKWQRFFNVFFQPIWDGGVELSEKDEADLISISKKLESECPNLKLLIGNLIRNAECKPTQQRWDPAVISYFLNIWAK